MHTWLKPCGSLYVGYAIGALVLPLVTTCTCCSWIPTDRFASLSNTTPAGEHFLDLSSAREVGKHSLGLSLACSRGVG